MAYFDAEVARKSFAKFFYGLLLGRAGEFDGCGVGGEYLGPNANLELLEARCGRGELPHGGLMRVGHHAFMTRKC